MESYLHPGHYDLVTPDGRITKWNKIDNTTAIAVVFIENISPAFVGFQIDPQNVFFNLKSVLAQLGIDATGEEYFLDPRKHCAEVQVTVRAYGSLAQQMLSLLGQGVYLGKLFAADERRRVRTSDYLYRTFNRSDRKGRPLLALGGMQGSSNLILEKVDGHTVAYLSLQKGCIKYDESITGLLPTIAKALVSNHSVRGLLKLHQHWVSDTPKIVNENDILLVRTLPLHIRTVFGRVVNCLLPRGCQHTNANILQPDTSASGDIYELFGNSKHELIDIPLEFYTLEPHREHVFYVDRDQLQSCLEKPETLFKAFEKAPKPANAKAAVFVVKGTQLLNLQPKDWIIRDNQKHSSPGTIPDTRQALMIERYITKQPSYPFLKSIEDGLITSQGILLTYYFPSPVMKRMLLSTHVHQQLKGIYFLKPSLSHDVFFSQEDRNLLNDLAKFGIPVYWVDQTTHKILQYVQKPGRDSGLFVPINLVQEFLQATMFGIYGSNLLPGQFEGELRKLFEAILEMKGLYDHPLINANTPLALLTGGGPGVMEVGNRIARQLKILSCANILDFQFREDVVVNEQLQNPHIDAKMTYRLDKLVERQAEFHLDFPIFQIGGIGTDFEHILEEVRRKVGAVSATPILLFGNPEYWRSKITPRFQCNLETGTTIGSEWVSNCFYCVQNAQQAIKVYRQYLDGNLSIGYEGPTYKDGFCIIED